MVTGNSTGRSHLRSFVCFTPDTDWASAEECKSKTLVERAIQFANGDSSGGVVRSDSLLSNLPPLLTQESLELYMSERGLWSLFDAPDPLHLVLNHSCELQTAVLHLVPSRIAELDAALSADCDTTITRGARAGWQWRLIWASEAWEKVLVGASEADHLALMLVQSFRRCVAAMYAPPALRTAKALLTFAAACFVHRALWLKCGQRFLFAEHCIFPHMPRLFHDIAPSLLLTEPIESAFRPIRRFYAAGIGRGENGVRDMLQRLLAWNAVKRSQLDVYRSFAVPVDIEPCPRCIEHGSERTTVDPARLGDVRPLLNLLRSLGFGDSSWSVLPGHVIQLHDAHLDPTPARPVLPSLAELAASLAAKNKTRARELFSPAPLAQPPPAELGPANAAPAQPAQPQQPVPAGPVERKAMTRTDDTNLYEMREDDRPISEGDYLDDAEIAAFFGTEEEVQEEDKEEARERAREAEDEEYFASSDKRQRKSARAKRHSCGSCGKSLINALSVQGHQTECSGDSSAEAKSKEGKRKHRPE